MPLATLQMDLCKDANININSAIVQPCSGLNYFEKQQKELDLAAILFVNLFPLLPLSSISPFSQLRQQTLTMEKLQVGQVSLITRQLSLELSTQAVLD